MLTAELAPLKFLVNYITHFIPESLSLTFKFINLPKGSSNNITGFSLPFIPVIDSSFFHRGKLDHDFKTNIKVEPRLDELLR